MRIWTRLTKQYKVSGKIGGFKDLLGRTLFYVSIVNFILIAATAYHTTLRDIVHTWLPWFNFPVFLGVLVAGLLLMMILEYKVVLPSAWAFSNRQQYEHQNLLRKQLDRIEETLEEMKGKKDGKNGKRK